MATADKGFSQNVNELIEVQVVKSIEGTDANVVMEIFITKRSDAEMQSQMKNNQFCVNFPVLEYNTGGAKNTVRENMDKFFRKVSENNNCFIAAPIDRVKSWTIKEYCQILLERFLHHTKVGDLSRKQSKLIICAGEDHSFDEAVKVCKEKIAMPNTTEPSQAVKHEENRKSHAKIVVKKGYLQEIEADVLACTVPANGNLKESAVSRAVLEKAGKKLQSKLDKKLPLREVSVVKGCELECKHVLFGVLWASEKELVEKYRTEEDYCKENVHRFVQDCLDKADRLGSKSIAFPAIATGNLRYPVDIVAEQMFTTVEKWVSTSEVVSIEEVVFVICPEDTVAIQEFKNAEKRHATNPAEKNIESVKVGTGLNQETDGSEFPLTKQTFMSKNPQQTISSLNRSIHGTKTVNMAEDVTKGDPRALDQLPSNREVKNDEIGENNRVPVRPKEIKNGKTESRNTNQAVCPQFSWSKDAKEFQMFVTKENVEVKVYSANILCVPVDSIVNAANSNLAHIGGIAKAIAKAAGKDLAEEGRKYLKKHKKLKVGEACTTGPGNMPYKCVIHAVGPCWSDYKPYSLKDVERCETDLYTAVVNSLSEAEKYGVKTVAVSSISSGNYGCPHDMCCVQYAKAVLDYSHLSKSPLTEIHFVNTNINMVKMIKAAFKSMIKDEVVPEFYRKSAYCKHEPVDQKKHREIGIYPGKGTKQGIIRSKTPSGRQTEKYEDQKDQMVSQRKKRSEEPLVVYPFTYKSIPPGQSKEEFTCCLGNGQNLFVYTGDILSLKDIDMIVCGNIPSGKTKGKLAEALDTMGGSTYRLKKEAKFKKPVKAGSVILCSGQDFVYLKWIAHAVLYMKKDIKGEDDRRKKMKSVFSEIFSSMKSKKCKSLALPLIGTGVGSYDPQYCAEILIESLTEFCLRYKRECNIHLVNLDDSRTQMAVDVIDTYIRENVKPYTEHAKSTAARGKGSAQALRQSQPHKTNNRESFKVNENGGPNAPYQKSHGASNDVKPHTEHVKSTAVRQKGSAQALRQSQTLEMINRESFNVNENGGPNAPNQKSHGASNHQAKYRQNGTYNKLDLNSHYPSGKRSSDDATNINSSTDIRSKRNVIESGQQNSAELHTEDIRYADRNSRSPDEEETEEAERPGNLNIIHDPSQKVGATCTSESEEEDDDDDDSDDDDVSSDNSDQPSEQQSYDNEDEETYVTSEQQSCDNEDKEICVICMEDIKNKSTLPCGHIFCTDCIEEQFTYKEVCPTCGKVCGIIKGDQPKGYMDVVTNERSTCAGFEGCGRIEITYRFPEGIQGPDHPSPGTRYKGITRTAYLPNNRRGKEICAMLRVAFDRKLIFTIGRSRTTGAEGVITWNDIHHKTDPRPKTQFGYPDPTYLDRVTEELEIKGVTVNDIATLSASRGRHR